MRPQHPTVTSLILCSGRAIPVSPLIAPTQQYIQQTCNKSQHAPKPSVPTPIPTAKLIRATHCNPTNPPTIYPCTKPITPFNTHSSPAYIEPNDDGHETPLHDTTGRPSKTIHHVDLQKFHAKPSTMSSTLQSTHRLSILSCKLLPGRWIASSKV
jgi:hypothetical protein